MASEDRKRLTSLLQEESHEEQGEDIERQCKRQDSAERKRLFFRSSRNSDQNLLHLIDGFQDEDVFAEKNADNKQEVVQRGHGPRPARCKSDSALPDLIQSSSHGDDAADDSENDDGGQKSPDVVLADQPRRRSILKPDPNSEEAVRLRKHTRKLQRSVSFQQGTDSAEEKRDSYRKSSGYCTGSGSDQASSLQSQNSQTSTISSDAGSSVWFSDDAGYSSINIVGEESDQVPIPDFDQLISLDTLTSKSFPEDPVQFGLGDQSTAERLSDKQTAAGIPNCLLDLESLKSGKRKNFHLRDQSEFHTLPQEAEEKNSVNLRSNSTESSYQSSHTGISFRFSDSKQVQLQYQINHAPQVSEVGTDGGGTVSNYTSEGFCPQEDPDDLLPHLSILSHSISEDGNGGSEENSTKRSTRQTSNDSSHTEQNESGESTRHSSQGSSTETTRAADDTYFGADDTQDAVENNQFLPNFGAIMDEDDNSVQLPTDIGFPLENSPSVSPSHALVLNKYCTGESRESPENPTAPITPSFFEKLSHNPPSPPRQQINSNSLSYMHEVQQNFLENPEWFEYEYPYTFCRRLMNIPSDGSVSFSPHFWNDIAQGDTAAGSELTVEAVEDAARCQDLYCQICHLVRRLLIGLQHALSGTFSYTTSPEIQQLCKCLYQHARRCDVPLYRCIVPWCYVLRNYSDVEPVSVHLIFHWIKSKYDIPTMTDDVLPVEDVPDRFCKLNTCHHHDQSTTFEVLFTLGTFGNVLVLSETNRTVEGAEALVEEDETLYVLKKIFNQDSSDVSQADIYCRLSDSHHDNLVSHFWLAEYGDVIHICTEFILGNSLEELLCQQILLIPAAVVEMMVQIASAVQFLHRHGIIYLYWSSGNILLDSERRRVLVSNLSLSVTEEDQDIGYLKMSLPPWLVLPEIDSGITMRSDCWGAACLMTEMLTGHPVWYQFCHDKPEELWKKIQNEAHNPAKKLKSQVVHEDLLRLLHQCFKINVDERISFEDLCTAIEAMLH